MVARTFLAFDNESLTIASGSPSGTAGDPIINNSNTPDGTIFEYSSGFAQQITVDDTGGDPDTFEDDQSGSHTVLDGGGLVANGNGVESESIIVLRALDSSGNQVGPEITLSVFSQNGAFSNVWGYSTDTPLVDGVSYVKVSGSNAGASDYIDFVPCFGPGTLIATPDGDMDVEDIVVGQRVWTLTDGAVPVRWIATTTTDGTGDMAPVVFAPGVIGNAAELVVSPQHRILIQDERAEMLFGVPELLVAAKHLCGMSGVSRRPQAQIRYTHMMFDRHQIVRSQGALTESFFFARTAVSGVDAVARAELLSLFPSLDMGINAFGNTAAPVLTAHEGAVLTSYLD